MYLVCINEVLQCILLMYLPFFTYSVYRVLEMSLCLDPACLFHRCHIITCQLPHCWKLIILIFLIANDAAMTAKTLYIHV